VNPKALARIERLNYLLGMALVASFALWTSTFFTLGVLVGVCITCLNFSMLRMLVTKLLTLPPEKHGRAAMLFLPKMTGTILAAALAVFLLPISPIGLGIGFSIFLVSIMVESIRFMTNTTLMG